MNAPADPDTLEASPTLADGATQDGPPPTHASAPGPLETVDPAHYAIGREIARGGMGVVREAEDRRAGRSVALKELLGDPTPYRRRRFEREARITAQLQHPNIVPVYEVGQWPDGLPFFAMKLVGGRPLDVVADEALDDDARLALVPRILPAVDAIAYAHDNRIIHRDLKPANVLLGEFGETIVIDWGLAKGIGEVNDSQEGEGGRLPHFAQASGVPGVPALPASVDDNLTAEGAILGTPAYMPPEQARTESLDARADVYSLGALLYHALSGHPPYPGQAGEALRGLMTGPPEPLASRAPGAPPDLVSIVNKAMAREPADRYPDARELARDLDAFRTGRLVGAYQYTSWELVTRFVRRNRALTAALASLVVLAAVAVAFVVREQRIGERERERAVAAETRARSQERETHQRLAQVHWQSAVRRLGRGDYLGAELLAAAAMVESPDHPRGPHHGLLAGSTPSALRLAGPAATWSAARALRFATLSRTLDEHSDWIYHVLVSNDDRWLVTTSADRRALIWDMQTGRVHRALEGHRGVVFQAALDAPSSRLATSAYDGTIRIWSFPDGELLRTIEHPADRVYGVCFAADGTVLGAGAGGQVAVFEAETGALLRTIDATTFIPWRLNCPGDQPIAVLGTGGPEAVVLDLASASVLHHLVDTSPSSSGAGARVRVVELTEDGREIVTADDAGFLRRFDRTSGELLERAQLDGHYDAMAVSLDGRWLALGADKITIVDAETLRPVARLDGHEAGVAALSFDASGARLFSGSDDHRVVEWVIPMTRDALLLTAPSESQVDVIAQSDDGRWLVAAGDDATVRVWDARTGRAHRSFEGHTAPVRAAAFVGADAATTTGMDRTLWVHDLVTGESEPVARLPHFGDELSLSPDRETLAIASGDGDILLRDQSSGVLRSVEDAHAERAWWVGFDPFGMQLASTDFGGQVVLIDPQEARVIRRWHAHDTRIYDASWRPDGEELTTVALDGWLRGWDPHSGDRVREWRVLDGEPARSVAWSPDGGRLLVTTDRGARVYLEDGTLEARLDLSDRTTAGGWTADGRMVFASGGRVYILPLDHETGQEDPERLLADAEQDSGTTLDAIMERSSAR